jgi:hypothetical protein
MPFGFCSTNGSYRAKIDPTFGLMSEARHRVTNRARARLSLRGSSLRRMAKGRCDNRGAVKIRCVEGAQCSSADYIFLEAATTYDPQLL